MKKPREFWIKAIGFQDDREIRISMEGGTELYGHIDLTNLGENRWINTLVQQVDPGTNPISMRTKWLNVIEKSAYDEVNASWFDEVNTRHAAEKERNAWREQAEKLAAALKLSNSEATDYWTSGTSSKINKALAEYEKFKKEMK